MTARTLVLLRHAKAESPDGYPDDFERPLSRRGRTDAEAAGQWLAARGLRPDQVLCSSAIRTRETWQAVAPQFEEPPVLFEPRLYLAGLTEAIELVERTEATVESLLVIGHNPTLSVLSALLDPDGVDGEGLATAGIAVHRLDAAWSELEKHRARLVETHTARGR